MAKQFDTAEWKKITAKLRQTDKASARKKAKEEGSLAAFGLPERREQSIVMASWNIRKFGKESGHSQKAREFFAEFGSRCDLLAIQEIQSDMFSLRDLRDRMAAKVPNAKYRILCSDVTGRAPGSVGLAERLAFIYDENRIRHTDIASDISFDRGEVIRNVNGSLEELRKTVLEEVGGHKMAEQAKSIFNTVKNWSGFDSTKMNHFFDFIRSPHVASFDVLGDDAKYNVALVNAHLHYGRPKQREKEFLTLLEWVFLRSQDDAPITMILGDLNLDFKSSNRKRRDAIEAYLSKLNKSGSKPVKVNFPFLYDHPIQGHIRTNARESETFDQIAYFHQDPRLPLAEHNKLAGSSVEDFFDYGMFNFVELFKQSGVIGTKADGKPDFSNFEHDVSDHMPIWARLPVPVKDQWTFDQLQS